MTYIDPKDRVKAFQKGQDDARKARNSDSRRACPFIGAGDVNEIRKKEYDDGYRQGLNDLRNSRSKR